jgi:CRISPR-associated protein Cmr2
MSRLLHCTIGPVQGFIDQARRTRDLWAGSFLLSCLAGVAMREIRRRGGRIVFPVVENDSLLAALEASGTDITGPLVGSLPNRFKAELPDDFGDIAEVRTAVLAYWSRIAETVRRTILGELVRPGTEPGLIWSQQIGNFFEIAWVAGLDSGDGSDGAWLDRRKNWRNHARRAERGDHCMLITELQELSGEIRALDRARQNDFWDDVRRAIRSYLGERNHTYDTLELRPTERLSEVAL